LRYHVAREHLSRNCAEPLLVASPSHDFVESLHALDHRLRTEDLCSGDNAKGHILTIRSGPFDTADLYIQQYASTVVSFLRSVE
jgi:hypothetical protein